MKTVLICNSKKIELDIPFDIPATFISRLRKTLQQKEKGYTVNKDDGYLEETLVLGLRELGKLQRLHDKAQNSEMVKKFHTLIMKYPGGKVVASKTPDEPGTVTVREGSDLHMVLQVFADEEDILFVLAVEKLLEYSRRNPMLPYLILKFLRPADAEQTA